MNRKEREERLEKHKQLILEFLKESFPTKEPILIPHNKKYLYQCRNKDGDFAKVLKFAGELYAKNLGTPVENLKKELAELDKCSPNVFTGRGYITCDEDWQKAVNRLQSINPSRDWNMFEIEEYKGIFMVYD